MRKGPGRLEKEVIFLLRGKSTLLVEREKKRELFNVLGVYGGMERGKDYPFSQTTTEEKPASVATEGRKIMNIKKGGKKVRGLYQTLQEN